VRRDSIPAAGRHPSGIFRLTIEQYAPRVRRALLTVIVLLASFVLAASARADADPASDTLYMGRVFLPLSTPVSPRLAQRLAADAVAAEQAGTAIRVALIASPTDLGGVPSLFGRPTEYARFLDAELQFVYTGRVLVVMPQGAGLAKGGRLVADAAVVGAHVKPGGDGLARTAIELVEKLSGTRAAPGVTVPQPRAVRAPRHVLTVPATQKKGGGVPVWASAAIAVGAVALLLVPGFLLVRRRRSTPFAEPPPDPDDPYRYRGP
jgi:hypothetical protein